MRDLNKFKGCLVGGAVGDALGYAVEFMPASSICKKYGESGISEYELHGGVAEISDDTQMTLFTATGLLTGTTREMTRGIMGDYAECYIAHSYRDWYRTQTETYPLPKGAVGLCVSRPLVCISMTEDTRRERPMSSGQRLNR